MRVAVLGGGVTGITATRLLVERGYQVDLFEAESKLGGLARTDQEKGFVYDIAGGHIIHSRDESLLRYMLEVLGEENVVRNVRNTKILHKDRFIKYPFENSLGELPPEDNYFCTMEYIKAHYAREQGQLGAPRNFREWILYRFGRGIAELFMFPYNQKIWNMDLSEMSLEWIDGRVPLAPIEEVVRSAVGIPTEGYKHQGTFYYPRRGGIQALVDHLAAGLEGHCHLATPVRAVNRCGDRWEVNGCDYDRVLSTIPLQELACALRGIDEEVKQAALSLRYNSMLTILIGLDGPAPHPFSWLYLPGPEQGPFNRITYLSNYSPENAPPGKSSVLVEVTYPGGSDISASEAYLDSVIGALDRLQLLDRRRVEHVAHRKIPYAYLVHDLNYKRNTERVHSYLEREGVAYAGRFSRYTYINMDKAIQQAREVIEKQF